jgi:hypothetical protein
MPKKKKEIEPVTGSKLINPLYFLKNLDKFDRIPEKIKDKNFEKVFKIAEYQKLNTEERQAYEDSLKYYRDLKNSMDFAEETGFKKAEEVLLPILEEAKKNESEAKKQVIDLIKLLESANVSIELIMGKTGLSRDEIDKL